MLDADVRVFFQEFDLRFTGEELDTLGRLLRTSPIDNIQRQQSPTGVAIKTNKPATLAMKRREGRKPYSLIDEFQQFLDTASYAIQHQLDRMGVTVVPAGVHAAKQSKSFKEVRNIAKEARRAARDARRLGQQARAKAARTTAASAEFQMAVTPQRMATVRNDVLIGWLEDKGYFFFGITPQWADAFQLRVAKMLAARVDEYTQKNIERLRQSFGASS